MRNFFDGQCISSGFCFLVRCGKEVLACGCYSPGVACMRIVCCFHEGKSTIGSACWVRKTDDTLNKICATMDSCSIDCAHRNCAMRIRGLSSQVTPFISLNTTAKHIRTSLCCIRLFSFSGKKTRVVSCILSLLLSWYQNKIFTFVFCTGFLTTKKCFQVS